MRQLCLINIQEMCVYHIICNIPNRISSVTLTKPYVGLERVSSIVHTNISNICVRQSHRQTSDNGCDAKQTQWRHITYLATYDSLLYVIRVVHVRFLRKNNIIFLKETGFVFSTYHLTHTPSSVLFNRKLRCFRFCALRQYSFVTFHWYLTRLFFFFFKWKNYYLFVCSVIVFQALIKKNTYIFKERIRVNCTKRCCLFDLVLPIWFYLQS